MKARNVVESFKFAGMGIRHAVRGERNIRIHLVCAVLVAAFAFALGLDTEEACMVTIAATIVISAEMFNTAIERCVDMYTSEYSPLAAVAKDVAAGAVLVSAVGAAIVGIMVFGPHLVSLFSAAR